MVEVGERREALEGWVEDELNEESSLLEDGRETVVDGFISRSELISETKKGWREGRREGGEWVRGRGRRRGTRRRSTTTTLKEEGKTHSSGLRYKSLDTGEGDGRRTRPEKVLC